MSPPLISPRRGLFNAGWHHQAGSATPDDPPTLSHLAGFAFVSPVWMSPSLPVSPIPFSSILWLVGVTGSMRLGGPCVVVLARSVRLDDLNIRKLCASVNIKYAIFAFFVAAIEYAGYVYHMSHIPGINDEDCVS